MRALLIVLDIPEIDSSRSDSHVALPALDALGFWKALSADVFHPRSQGVHGCWGYIRSQTRGHDATSEFWEMAGVVLDEPLPTFTRFPDDFVRAIEKDAGVEFIGNRAASGLAIMEELGAEHLRTRKPILYTSSDSVLQIAAHEEAIPLPKLYEICRVARRHSDKRRIGRVIARPFRGQPGRFERTPDRRDHAMPPPRTVLNAIAEAGLHVEGVGEVSNRFAGSGITRNHPFETAADGLGVIKELWERDEDGLIFAELRSTDWMHTTASSEARMETLRTVDHWLARFEPRVEQDDLLLITMTDFIGAREDGEKSGRFSPLFMLHGDRTGPLGTRRTAADLAATLAHYFALRRPWPAGESFLRARATRSFRSPISNP
jgi:phosphopentomutase